MCIKEKATRSGNSYKHRKDNKFRGQQKRAFKAFFERPKTMLMVSIETGILRANLCRYVAEWRKLNLIKVVAIKECKISKRRAGYYSSNPIFMNPSKNRSHGK